MLKLLIGTLFSPIHTLRQIADERPVLSAAVVTLLGAWGWAFGSRLASPKFTTPADFAAQFFPTGASIFMMATKGSLFWTWVVFAVVAILLWLFRTALFHLMAELAGGSGKAFSLLATSGFADLPFVLLVPAGWLCARLATGPYEVVVTTIWYALIVMIHVWAAMLAVVGIRLTHRIHTGTAAAIFILNWPFFSLAISVLLAYTDVQIQSATEPTLPTTQQRPQDNNPTMPSVPTMPNDGR
jgi:hypothetical protein